MCAVSLGWSGRECVRLADDRVRDVRSEGKATLLQAAPGFATTAWLRERGWPVDPACGHGLGDMVAYRRCVKIELHAFGARATSSPNKIRMGCWLLLLWAGWWSPNRCSSAIANESISTARRAGVAGTEAKISIVQHTNRSARIRYVGEFGRLRRGLLPKGLTPYHSRGAVLIRFPLQARPRD